ncbi:MAG: hypothetical protein ABSC90_03510 [Acidimicrobiales bacterium]|jgi:hypothetical protein
MTTSTGNEAAPAYTRASVLAYLKAAEEERQRIRLAIAEARARKERAMGRVDRLGSPQQDYPLQPDHPTGDGPDGVRGHLPTVVEGDASREQVQWSMATNGVNWLPADSINGVAHA